MKIKNRVFSFIFAFLLVMPAMFFMTACGGDTEYAWGKTFSFQGVLVDNKGQSATSDQNGITYFDLLKREYDNGNLDLANITFASEKHAGLTSSYYTAGKSADEFIAMLDNFAKTYFEEMYSDFSIKIDSKGEKTATVIWDGYTTNFTVVASSNGNNNYDVMVSGGAYDGDYAGSFNSIISTNVDGKTKGCLNLQLYADGIPSPSYYYNCTISIPTFNVCEEATKETDENDEVISSYIDISYTPFFSKVTTE